jgi:DNA-binding NarL/FixJ family response regulator
MSGMMEMMMGKFGENFNPMEMCQNMVRAVSDTAKMAGHATPEVQALFEEWSNQVEKEILDILKNGVVSTPEIAKSMNISEDSVSFFLSKLLRDKKIKITSLDVL